MLSKTNDKNKYVNKMIEKKNPKVVIYVNIDFKS